MTRIGLKAAVAVMVLSAIAAASAGAQDKTVPRTLVKSAQQTLVTYGQDPQRPQDVARLRALDARWQKKDNVESFVKALLAAPASQRLAVLIGKHAYAGGAGAIWYGTLEFDESTKTNSVQVSWEKR
jgi:hypothetical protein